MQVSIFTPYLDTLGGGERYMLSIARALLEEGHKVSIETQNPELIPKAQKRFNLNLEGLRPVPTIDRGGGFDLCVWLSDGSIPTLRARKNILHFQRPFTNVDGRSLVNRMKLFRIHKVIVNSKFTGSFIDKEYPVKSVCLYPPVDVTKFKASKKTNTIVYVGRFSQLEQNKRQDVLLTAFLKFYPYASDKWKLVLAGGSEVGRTEEVDVLREHASGHPVEIIENPSFDKVKELYSTARFFWSAAGYGVDSNTDPQKMEHFGMTVVESMASKCIPLCFRGGGHLEIIEEGKNGYLWEKPQELLFITKRISKDSKIQKTMSEEAHDRAQDFSYEHFKNEFLKLL